MKLRILVMLVAVMVTTSSCSLFGKSYEDVEALYFTKDEVVLAVVPDHELRTLAVTYDENNTGVIGGDFFDRVDEIFGVFENYPVVLEDKEGAFAFSIEKSGGDTKKYVFDMTDDSDEFGLLDSFYTDVSELFSEEVY
ncbi:MAG: hypothetical protein ABID64_02665 [Nitrospirota bacterium]